MTIYLCVLILQKLFSKPKTSDHIQCTERRLKLSLSSVLRETEVMDLSEGDSIQHSLTFP